MTADTEPAPRKRVPLAVWWILAASAVLKLALIGPVADLPQKADERQYVAAARSIHEEGVPRYPNPNWDEAHPGPGMPYFMAACYAVAGEEGFKTAARVVQVVLSLFTALFVCLIAQRFLSDRTATLATALIALNPTHVAFTHYFWVETSYAFFVAAVAWLLVRSRDAERPSLGLLGAGLLGGVACLWRSVFLTQVPVVCLWLLFWGPGTPRSRARLAGVFVAGFVLAVAPWSIRNTLRYDRFLLVSTNAGALLAKSANPIKPECHDIGLDGWRKRYEAYYREHGPDFEGVIPLRPIQPRDPAENIVDRNSREIRAGLAFMLEHPWMTVEHSWIRLEYFFNPTSFLIRHLREEIYTGVPAVLEEVLVVLALAFTMVIFVFFVFGAALGPPGPERMFLVLMFLGTLAISVVTGMHSRYRLPLEPLMAPLVADGLLRLRELTSARARFWLITAPVLLLLVYVWIEYLPLNYPA